MLAGATARSGAKATRLRPGTVVCEAVGKRLLGCVSVTCGDGNDAGDCAAKHGGHIVELGRGIQRCAMSGAAGAFSRKDLRMTGNYRRGEGE